MSAFSQIEDDDILSEFITGSLLGFNLRKLAGDTLFSVEMPTDPRASTSALTHATGNHVLISERQLGNSKAA